MGTSLPTQFSTRYVHLCSFDRPKLLRELLAFKGFKITRMCVCPTVNTETLARLRLEMALVDCSGQMLEMYKIGYQSFQNLLRNI